MAIERVPAPQLDSTADAVEVGSYADIRSASLAVQHLRDVGFADDAAFVRPVAMAALAPALVTVPDAPRHRVAALIGAAAAVVSVALGASVLTALAAAPLAAAASYITVDFRLRLARARARRADHLVRAERFGVVCTGDAGLAEHRLATWWDPSAPPVPGTRRRRRHLVAARAAA